MCGGVEEALFVTTLSEGSAATVLNIPRVPCLSTLTGHPFEPSLASCPEVTQCLPVWRMELEYDVNKTFILDGIQFGFKIIDRDCGVLRASCKNYKSALLDNHDRVELQILKEIRLGRYIIVDNPPPVVSSLGAVPKAGGGIRVIHDLSRPAGGLNKYGVDSGVTYATVDEALKMIKPGSYLAKLDLSEAYRSLPIHPLCYNLTGLSWTFTGVEDPVFLFDARLPFGSSLSGSIFQSVSDSVMRMYRRRGFRGISYIDDLLIVADTKLYCECAYKCLCYLFEHLGL
jgi:hypothetical protein